MALIKDVYNKNFYKEFGKAATKVIPGFSSDKYIKAVYDHPFEKLEWKERLKLSTHILHTFMPDDFEIAAGFLCKIIDNLKDGDHYTSTFPYLFFQDYIATYGIEHFRTSMKSIGHITTFISGEFAVRPFLLKYGQPATDIMLEWSHSPNHHLRRLSSEGSRPRLPWGVALQFLKKDPAPIIPILEKLKNDPSEYVRRSVANSLNDIGKDHPSLLIEIAKSWQGISKDTDAIIKHACRNLLKQGHPEILTYYGLDGKNVEISDLNILNTNIRTGEYLEFGFSLKNRIELPQHIRLEYAIYYLRANGSHTKKVFKISEKTYAPLEFTGITRRQSFRIITTKIFYEGTHYLSIIANGNEGSKQSFELNQ